MNIFRPKFWTDRVLRYWERTNRKVVSGVFLVLVTTFTCNEHARLREIAKSRARTTIKHNYELPNQIIR